MKALVTGCAGFIGSHLTESLLRDGHEVLGVDRLNDNYPESEKRSNLERSGDFDAFTFVCDDLATWPGLQEAVDGRDVIFHLAGEPGVRGSWGNNFGVYLHNNILATQRLLDAVKTWPGQRFVYASSSSVYGQADVFPTPENARPKPISPYGLTKLSAEQLCEVYQVNFGVPTVALRFFSVYGPRQRPDMAFRRFSQSAISSQPIKVFGDGRQTRDFTYVSDIVGAMEAAAVAQDAIGNVYNIGGGTRVSLIQAIELLEKTMNVRIDMELQPQQRGDARDTGADTSKAQRDLGFSPEVSLAEGLALQVAWLRECAL